MKIDELPACADQSVMQKQSFGKAMSLFGTLGLLSSIVACSNAFHPSTDSVATQITNGVGCTSLKATMWTELYKVAEASKGFPTPEELQQALEQKLRARFASTVKNDVASELSRTIASAYGAVTNEAQNEGKTPKELIQELALMELGDEHTAAKASVQSTLSQTLASADAVAKANDLACGDNGAAGGSGAGSGGGVSATPPPLSTSSVEGVMLDTWKAQAAGPVYGIWKTMATAYQSCEAVGQALLGPSSTPDVQGITVESKTSSSGGKWRDITDLTTFLKTQPYLHNRVTPDASCFAVEKSPMIYDFGGKPAYTSAADSDLNLFAENGSGATNQLGIDCSGFVTTAYLTAGLKVSSTNPQRALYAGAIPARNYMSPDGSGTKLDCLKYAEMKDEKGIKPGDTLASSGHVVMIDHVGADPFGLAGFTSAAQCVSANINPAHYDFSIAHSSSVLNGIGISRMKGSEYFAGTSEMATAIRAYAVGACQAKFGVANTPMPTTAHLVRHTGEAKCIDKVIALRQSSCLKSCRASIAN